MKCMTKKYFDFLTFIFIYYCKESIAFEHSMLCTLLKTTDHIANWDGEAHLYYVIFLIY